MTYINHAATGLHGAPVSGRTSFYGRNGKRILDVSLALVLLPFLTPFIALIWVLVRLSGNCGFYGHTRIGQLGEPFTCWKICTMHPDADRLLADYLGANPDAAQEWAETQKLSNDPRVTRLGRILRATSLDELPQIWNVLKGDMSFVGPRPIVTEELLRYGEQAHQYLALRPGITGLWQIHGRGKGTYAERVHLDVSYARVMTLATDLSLILATLAVMIRMTGR